MEAQPKTYDQALKESFAEYSANTPGQTEYMKIDFDAGFAAGYNAAMNNVAQRRRIDALRERAAIAAMQGVLANPDKYLVVLSEADTALLAVRCADALINQLNTPQS